MGVRALLRVEVVRGVQLQEPHPRATLRGAEQLGVVLPDPRRAAPVADRRLAEARERPRVEDGRA